jgi:hypothetical protein
LLDAISAAVRKVAGDRGSTNQLHWMKERVMKKNDCNNTTTPKQVRRVVVIREQALEEVKGGNTEPAPINQRPWGWWPI